MTTLLLLVAVAILPACGRSAARDDVNVVVNNTGAEPVRVRIEVRQFGDDDADEVIVAPGNSAGFNDDHVERVEASVWRTSDGFLIFLDSWDRDDIRRLDERISVTVSP
ncbi:MAG: hypothetical protein EHM91_06405 [Planctomycetota bacterium]|nr:MAG: hypothetical protein EHM91_06405 [Planctomycetota bacterium]